jgi:hypothetical protein
MMTNANKTVRLAMSISPDGYVTRRGGSFVEGLVMEGLTVRPFLANLDWKEITSEVVASGCSFGTCRYFKASLPEGVKGFLGIKLLGELTPDELSRVRVEAAHHTNRDGSERGEMILDTIEPTPVDFVVISIGSPGGKDATWVEEDGVVYTWHPGMPCHPGPSPGPDVAETRRQLTAGEIHPHAPVKLSQRA